MAKDIISRIRRMQNELPLLKDLHPPAHEPEMLLIGCVDARLNITDIGIPYGKALVFRDVAALVAGTSEAGDAEHLSEAAVLEFAVNVMRVRDVVIMGHTDCGGIRACLEGEPSPSTEHIHKYLAPLNEVRAEVVARGGGVEAQARAMEEAAVRQSVANLMTYPAVAMAVNAKKLRLHGWVINTATKRISEMNVENGRFAPMALDNATGQYGA